MPPPYGVAVGVEDDDDEVGTGRLFVAEAEEEATADDAAVETGELSEVEETTIDEDEAETGEFSEVAEIGDDDGV